MNVTPRHRVLSLIVYAMLLTTVQVLVVKPESYLDQSSIWLYNGFASLLLGSRLLNPHFTPPADAATNGFVAFSSLLVGLAFVTSNFDIFLVWAVIAFCACVVVLSIVVLLIRDAVGLETRLWVRAADRAARGLGDPIFIFTLVVLTAVWLFNRDRPSEVFAIVATWTMVVALKPVEAGLSFWSWLRDQPSSFAKDVVGQIAAHQSPGMVLIRQLGQDQVKRGTPLLIADNNGPPMLGVALNYVGRDEGNLLRALTVAPPIQILAKLSKQDTLKTTGVALSLHATAAELGQVPEIQRIQRLCGVVDSDTTLGFPQFEVIDDRDLAEGRLVEARVGQQWTIFQIIEGLTREDIVQQKNKYGYARARARKIGRWNDEKDRFESVSWLPRINTPVYLMEIGAYSPRAEFIGHFPGTPYGASIDVVEAVTHNTAILGILGVGKSYAALELVERMITRGVKVVCLDLTNQYEEILKDFIDFDHDDAQRQELIRIGKGDRRAKRIKEEGGSHQAFYASLVEKLREFVSPKNKHHLRIYNPAHFEVIKQVSGMFGDAADMATLTPCEITGMISEAALTACQELGMTDEARVCLVYEEAHSLVPEWNSVAAEGNKAATARSARAILQGRKYGLGCLLITQRTANVTKTILNQCNTIFAMRTFDDTGKEFLSNYIGGDYASILPSLEARQAVVFGKASSCENPVLLRLNDREAFVRAFRQEPDLGGEPVTAIATAP